jgi:hypothetical protein
MITKRILKTVAAISLTALTQVSQAQEIKAVLPGEDGSSALLIGQGFNSVTRDALGHCVKVGPLQTQSGNETGQVAEFKLIDIRNESDLRRNLNISGVASLDGFLVGRVDGRLDYAHSINKQSAYRYLMVKTRVGNQLEIGSAFEYQKSVSDLLRKGTPAANQAFLANCGNEFVYARRTGAEFIAVVEFETKTESEAKKYDLAIAKTAGKWQGGGQFKDEMSKVDIGVSTKVSMIKFGGTGAIPAIRSMDEFIREFPNLVQVSMNGPVTLELVSKTYGGVDPVDVMPDDSQLKKMNFTVEALAQNREKAHEVEKTIEYITNNPQDYKIDPAVHDFDKIRDTLNSFVGENDRISRSCLIGDWSQCVIPNTHKFPSVKLPTRRM